MTEDNMMKQKARLIIGYGKPGIKYAKNRGNVGYMIVDNAVEKARKLYYTSTVSGWIMRPKYMFMTTNLNPLTMVVKPRTSENKFDDIAFNLYAFYKVVPKDFYIIYPDKSLTLGQFIIDKNSISAPEGVLKMEKKLNSQDFWRVRIGIAGANEELNDVEYAKIKYLGEKLASELEIVHITSEKQG